MVGQIIIDLTKLTPARILVGYVVSGVALTGLGCYKPLVKLAGCGATTPLSGFGYSLAVGVEKAVAEKGAIGIITGGLTATAAGITAVLCAALVCSLIFTSKQK